MSWIEDFTKFQELEDKLNLFDLSIQDVLFWERIRFQVYAAVGRRELGKSKAEPGVKSGRSRLKRLLLSIFKLSKNALFPPKSDVLMVCSARRLLEKDGLYWDIYTDPIIEAINPTPLAIETHFENRHYSPAKTEKLRFLDYIEFLSYVKRRLGFVKISLASEEVDILKQIEQEIENKYSFQLDMVTLTKRILEERKARLPSYRKMLKRARPKIVIFAQSYGWEDLIEASKSLGIPTAELQHGIIGPYQPGYSFAGKRKKDTFTDYLFSWGDYWNEVAPLPIPPENVITVGFPYINMKKESYSDISKKKQILFISQYTIGERLSRFAAELSEIPELDYDIVYKLHPQELSLWRESYPWLAESRVKVIDQPAAVLHELFAESSISVGVYSTAVYEGLAFGLRTFLVDSPGIELMSPLLESEHVNKVSTPNEMMEYIIGSKSSKKLDVEFFFKVNATENIISFLKDRILVEDKTGDER
ncbi:MAG: hypothetical protein ACXAEF_08685 [Candidatus Thorarchaeota archaeon]|jgi:hypothetical protein